MYALMHVDFTASERPPRTCLALTSILLIIFEKRQVGLQTFEFISVQDRRRVQPRLQSQSVVR